MQLHEGALDWVAKLGGS